jgi:hypothetical protein
MRKAYCNNKFVLFQYRNKLLKLPIQRFNEETEYIEVGQEKFGVRTIDGESPNELDESERKVCILIPTTVRAARSVGSTKSVSEKYNFDTRSKRPTGFEEISRRKRRGRPSNISPQRRRHRKKASYDERKMEYLKQKRDYAMQREAQRRKRKFGPSIIPADRRGQYTYYDIIVNKPSIRKNQPYRNAVVRFTFAGKLIIDVWKRPGGPKMGPLRIDGEKGWIKLKNAVKPTIKTYDEKQRIDIASYKFKFTSKSQYDFITKKLIEYGYVNKQLGR